MLLHLIVTSFRLDCIDFLRSYLHNLSIQLNRKGQAKQMKNKITMVEKSYIEILVAKSGQSLPLHSHECFCLGMVQRGTVTFRIGDQEKVLTRGMAYLIPSNVGVTITTKETSFFLR